jgi:hypothetical protein
MFDDLNFSLDLVLALMTYTVMLVGIYWRMKIDVKSLEGLMKLTDAKIADIICDRKERWDKYQEERDKQDCTLQDILHGLRDLRGGISDVQGDIKAVKTDLEWIKKK